jgi:hypothetical protein
LFALFALSVSAVAAGPPRQDLSRIPVGFEANIGQTDKATRYLARGSDFWLLLGSSDVRLAVQSKKEAFTLKLKWIGGNREPIIHEWEPLPGITNYFFGSEPKDWYTNIPTYRRVEYQDVYPGIDLAFYGNQRQLEYDILLKPGASLDSVRLRFSGATRIEVDTSGDLVLSTPTGEIHQKKPLVYQKVAGVKRALTARYVLKRNVVGLKVDHYDHTRPLVIDPVLSYSSYFGGPDSEMVTGMAMDPSGNVYLTGTANIGLPTTAGAFQGHPATQCPCGFVVKFNPQLNSVIYSSFVWGTNPTGIAVDSSGSAYITGGAGSSLATPGAFQTRPGGQLDAFVAKVNAAGSALVYLTYLGGSGNEYAGGIAVDGGGNAYVTGTTMSPNFPVTPGAVQTQYAGAGDAYISKVSADGGSLIYSTYFGYIGSDLGTAITVDRLGYAYVTGRIHYCPNDICGVDYDAFVIILDPLGNGVFGIPIYGSAYDSGVAIVLDSAGNIYVAGVTDSTDLIVTPNAFQKQLNGGQDGFVAQIDTLGNLVYVSYFGASGMVINDPFGGTVKPLTFLQAIAVDANQNVSMLGFTAGMIVLKNPIQSLNGAQNAFVTKLSLSQSAASALLFSTYLGGTGDEMAAGISLDLNGNIVIAGSTNSTDFPVTPGAAQKSSGGQSDAFIARIVGSEPCGYGATPSAPSIAGSGGTATINIVAAAGCAWSAINNDPGFLSITSASSGSGNGALTVSAAPSSLVKSRIGTIGVAGQVISVNQQPGIICSFSLSGTGQSFAIAGGAGSITVTTNQQCTWTDSTSASWIHLGFLGTQGTQTLTFTVDANTGPLRSAAITIAGQTFTVNQSGAPSIIVNRSTLNFGILGSLVTAPQSINLSFSGLPNASWTAQTNGGFTVTPASGTGNATLLIAANPTGTGSGPLLIFAQGAANSPMRVTINIRGAASGPPFGSFDTPANGTTGIAGAIPVTGWSLDNVEVSKVQIWREPVPNEPAGLVFIGETVFIGGARPDVEASNPSMPMNYRGGWGYMLLTNFLPNADGSPGRGNGTYQLHALATNKAGITLDLGTRKITVDNAHASKPFGTIDTPVQGGTVSGNAFVNFGWALTQNPYLIPSNGSTLTVYLDSLPVGHPTYGQYRSDIASLFPGLANSSGAVGFYFIDTTQLANGVHTIAWSVSDNANRIDGIGSRYFTVQNTGTGTSAGLEAPVQVSPTGNLIVRRGFDLTRQAELSSSGGAAPHLIDMEELERIELQLGGTSGYLLVNGERRPLPVGSTLKDGSFYWQPGLGFLGGYDLIFDRENAAPVNVRVTIHPWGSLQAESPQ